MCPSNSGGPKVVLPPPFSNEARRVLDVIGTVPGPSPWYLDHPASQLRDSGGPLHWRRAGEHAPRAGKTLLVASRSDAVLAVADFYCYVRPLGDHRFLVWRTEEVGEGPSLQRSVRLSVFDADRLTPLADLDEVYATLGRHRRFHAASGELATCTLSAALSDDAHEVALPSELAEAGELLLLVDSTADGRRENHFDKMYLGLWILDAARGTLDVIPQDWFNGGPYDFGYQWVTRVARDPGDGSIAGEGIRLGLFRLDASHRGIKEWLYEYPFYHPERPGHASES